MFLGLRKIFAVSLVITGGFSEQSHASRPKIPFDPGCPRLLGSANPELEWRQIEESWSQLENISIDQARVIPWEDVFYDYMRSRNTRARLKQRYLMMRPPSETGRLPWRQLTPAEFKASEVYLADGLVWDSTGKRVTTDLGGVAGFADFVMDDQGRVRLWKYPVPGDVHHTSLGTPPGYWTGIALPLVAAAGEIRIVDGRIVAVNDKSGHYAPPTYLLAQFLDRLWLAGISWRDKQGKLLFEVERFSPHSYKSEEGRHFLRQGIPVVIDDL